MKYRLFTLCLLCFVSVARADSYDVQAATEAKRAVDSLAGRLALVRERYPQLTTQQITSVVSDALTMSLNVQVRTVDTGLDLPAPAGGGTPDASATHGAGIVSSPGFAASKVSGMINVLSHRHPELALGEILAIVKALNP